MMADQTSQALKPVQTAKNKEKDKKDEKGKEKVKTDEIATSSTSNHSSNPWPIESVPFNNYQTLVNYYRWLKATAEHSREAEQEQQRLHDYLLQHISDFSRTDEIVLDLAQLVYCEEEAITNQVFNRLFHWITEQHFSIHVLDAVASVSEAIQLSGQTTPSTADLISLLKALTTINIAKAQETSAFPAEILSHALYATNALLDGLYERAAQEKSEHREQGINQVTYRELKGQFTTLMLNLKNKCDAYPWHYYLCHRAQQTLKAIGLVSTKVQTRKSRLAGAQSIGMGAGQGLAAGVQAITGTGLLAAAIAGTVFSAGGAVVTLPPAIIAFGAGWYKAYQSGKSSVKHVRKAYKHLRREDTLTLEGFEQTVRKKNQTTLSEDEWQALKKQFADVFKAKQAENWQDTDAMAAVYYFTQLALRVTLPEDWITSIQGLFATLYLYNLSNDNNHVRNFILANCQRLHEEGYQAFPAVTATAAGSKDFYVQLLSEGSPRYRFYKRYLSIADNTVREKDKRRRGWKALSKETKKALRNHHQDVEKTRKIIEQDFEGIGSIRFDQMMPLSRESVTGQLQLKAIWEEWLPVDIKCYEFYRLTQGEPDERTVQDIKRELEAMRLTLQQVESLSYWGKLCLYEVTTSLAKKGLAGKPSDSQDETIDPKATTIMHIGQVHKQIKAPVLSLPEGAKGAAEDAEVLMKMFQVKQEIEKKNPMLTIMHIKEILEQILEPMLIRTERHHALLQAAPVGRDTLFHHAISGQSMNEPQSTPEEPSSVSKPSVGLTPGKG